MMHGFPVFLSLSDGGRTRTATRTLADMTENKLRALLSRYLQLPIHLVRGVNKKRRLASQSLFFVGDKRSQLNDALALETRRRHQGWSRL